MRNEKRQSRLKHEAETWIIAAHSPVKSSLHPVEIPAIRELLLLDIDHAARETTGTKILN